MRQTRCRLNDGVVTSGIDKVEIMWGNRNNQVNS